MNWRAGWTAGPELRALQLDAAIGRYEADEEVQDLLTASVGLNLAVDFLPGSFGWDPGFPVSEQEAARVLWLDAFTANVDRSWRNPNLLIWHRELWLIDHGAALYFHHSWEAGPEPERFAGQPYDSSEHVSPSTPGVPEVDAELAAPDGRALLTEILAAVPDDWLEPAGGPRRRAASGRLRRVPAGPVGEPGRLAAGAHRGSA